MQPQQFGGRLDVAASLEYFDGQPFEHDRETRMFFGPRNRHGFDSAFRALGSRCTGAENRFELHSVQMPPFSLGSMIGQRRVNTATRTNSTLADILQENIDPLRFQREFHLNNIPGVVQP